MLKEVKRYSLPFAVAAILLTGCAQAPKPVEAAATPAADTKPANDFPTLTRVEYVLQCMQQHGGENYDNLYHCTCSLDHIASKMTHEQFDQAQAFTYLYNTPGERGGEFRDPPQSEKLRTLLKTTKAEAAEKCFPALKQAPAKPASSK